MHLFMSEVIDEGGGEDRTPQNSNHHQNSISHGLVSNPQNGATSTGSATNGRDAAQAQLPAHDLTTAPPAAAPSSSSSGLAAPNIDEFRKKLLQMDRRVHREKARVIYAEDLLYFVEEQGRMQTQYWSTQCDKRDLSIEFLMLKLKEKEESCRVFRRRRRQMEVAVNLLRQEQEDEGDDGRDHSRAVVGSSVSPVLVSSTTAADGGLPDHYAANTLGSPRALYEERVQLTPQLRRDNQAAVGTRNRLASKDRATPVALKDHDLTAKNGAGATGAASGSSSSGEQFEQELSTSWLPSSDAIKTFVSDATSEITSLVQEAAELLQDGGEAEVGGGNDFGGGRGAGDLSEGDAIVTPGKTTPDLQGEEGDPDPIVPAQKELELGTTRGTATGAPLSQIDPDSLAPGEHEILNLNEIRCLQSRHESLLQEHQNLQEEKRQQVSTVAGQQVRITGLEATVASQDKIIAKLRTDLESVLGRLTGDPGAPASCRGGAPAPSSPGAPPRQDADHELGGASTAPSTASIALSLSPEKPKFFQPGYATTAGTASNDPSPAAGAGASSKASTGSGGGSHNNFDRTTSSAAGAGSNQYKKFDDYLYIEELEREVTTLRAQLHEHEMRLLRSANEDKMAVLDGNDGGSQNRPGSDGQQNHTCIWKSELDIRTSQLERLSRQLDQTHNALLSQIDDNKVLVREKNELRRTVVAAGGSGAGGTS
eukprot:g10922.t1